MVCKNFFKTKPTCGVRRQSGLFALKNTLLLQPQKANGDTAYLACWGQNLYRKMYVFIHVCVYIYIFYIYVSMYIIPAHNNILV